MNSWRTILWGSILLLLLGLGLFLGWRASKQSPWWSDAGAARPWSTRAALISPAAPTPAPLSAGPMPSFTFTSNQSELSFTFEIPTRTNCNPFSWQVMVASPELTVDLGIARLQLPFFAVGQGPPLPGKDNPWNVRVPGQFFRANGSPLSATDLKALNISAWDQELRYHDGFPALKLFLESTNWAEIRILNVRVFDATTHAPLESGSVSQSQGKRYATETGIALWHSTPVEIMLDIASGPSQVFEFAAQPGTSRALPCGFVHLLGILPGHNFSSSSSSDSTNTSLTVRTRLGEANPETTLAFQCENYEQGRPFEFEALDAAGQAIPSGGSSTMSGFVMHQFQTSHTNIAQLRVRLFPNLRRVVFRLPGLPGLPEANLHVRNLFEVRSSWMRFQTDGAMRRWLERVLQLEMRSSTWANFPNGTFPMSFTNATPTEILGVYLRGCPAGTSARVDAKKQELVIGPSRWKDWALNAWFKLKAVLK